MAKSARVQVLKSLRGQTKERRELNMDTEGISSEVVDSCIYKKDNYKEAQKMSNSTEQRENQKPEVCQDDASQNEKKIVNNNSITGVNKKRSLQKKKKSIMEEISSEGKWVIRTFTGYIVTLVMHPDRDRPENFESASAEKMWDTATEINLNRLKYQVQSGEYIPDNAIVEVDPNPLKAPTSRIAGCSARLETKEQRQENVTVRRDRRISVLELELKFVGLMLNIRECFSGTHQIEEGLTLFEEVSKLHITPLMLTKNPFTVNTIYCLCKYAGMVNQSDKNTTSKICEVKSKARDLYNKFQSLFRIPTNVSFEKYFKDKIALTWKMFRYNTDSAYELVNDPTSMF